MTKGKFKLLCMSFDGDYITESYDFKTVNEAWEHSNDMGSKWWFYPFHFVIKGKTIVDTPDLLERFRNKRIKTLSQKMKMLSELPEMQGADVEKFVLNLA